MKSLKHLQQFKGNPKKKQGGWVSIASLVVAAWGTYQAGQQGNAAANAAEQQAQAQRDAIAAQERAANVRAQQERIKAQREARIARAQVISGAASAGIGPGSSAISGAESSIASQLGQNIGAINVAQDFASQASAANQRAATAGGDIATSQARAAQWQALSSASMSIFNQTGGFSTIFGKPVKGVTTTPTGKP